jgi:hypothetical protein
VWLPAPVPSPADDPEGMAAARGRDPPKGEVRAPVGCLPGVAAADSLRRCRTEGEDAFSAAVDPVGPTRPWASVPADERPWASVPD